MPYFLALAVVQFAVIELFAVLPRGEQFEELLSGQGTEPAKLKSSITTN